MTCWDINQEDVLFVNSSAYSRSLNGNRNFVSLFCLFVRGISNSDGFHLSDFVPINRE